MKKLSLILGLFLGVAPATAVWADFEAVETVLGRVENVQKEAQNVQEQIKEVQSGINQARQGEFGPLKEIGGKVLKGVKLDSKQTKEVAENSDDLGKLEESIENTMVPQYTSKNQDETYAETKKVTDALKRENVSRFYALAFTTRTNMAKEAREKGEQDNPKEMEESREMVQATNEENLESADRVARILDIQLSIDEFAMTNLLQSFSVSASENEAETGDGGTK